VEKCRWRRLRADRVVLGIHFPRKFAATAALAVHITALVVPGRIQP
jgi:hypothetical protein